MGIFSIFRKKGKPKQLEPECRVIVSFDDDCICCKWPDQPDQTMAWSELKVVAIETTDEGPFSTDLYWILGAKDRVVSYPGGATGEQEMLSRLQELPGFDNESVISAMGCTDNRTFVCWEDR